MDTRDAIICRLIVFYVRPTVCGALAREYHVQSQEYQCKCVGHQRQLCNAQMDTATLISAANMGECRQARTFLGNVMSPAACFHTTSQASTESKEETACATSTILWFMKHRPIEASQCITIKIQSWTMSPICSLEQCLKRMNHPVAP